MFQHLHSGTSMPSGGVHPITLSRHSHSFPFSPIAGSNLLRQITVMPRPPKTPQEKKALSLRKDCRQSYFASGQKGARKIVPLRKRLENRRVRHKTDQALEVALAADDLRSTWPKARLAITFIAQEGGARVPIDHWARRSRSSKRSARDALVAKNEHGLSEASPAFHPRPTFA